MNANLVRWGAGSCGVLTALACAGAPEAVDDPSDEDDLGFFEVADDQSRCDFKGREDRVVQESRGPGARHKNVRRVFRVVGIGVDERKIIVCREVDTNLDGIKDIVRRYDDKGAPIEELADADYDGHIDTWIGYTFGKVTRVEFDANGDEAPDEKRLYVDGVLNRVQRDTNADGKADTWEIYAEGRLERLGVDHNHDGRVDQWLRDEAAVKESERKKREAALAKAAPTKAATQAGALESDDADDADGADEAETQVHERPPVTPGETKPVETKPTGSKPAAPRNTTQAPARAGAATPTPTE